MTPMLNAMNRHDPSDLFDPGPQPKKKDAIKAFKIKKLTPGQRDAYNDFNVSQWRYPAEWHNSCSLMALVRKGLLEQRFSPGLNLERSSIYFEPKNSLTYQYRRL